MVTPKQMNFYSDASKNEKLGFGAVFDKRWLFSQWEPRYIMGFDPSIEYLVLYAVIAALLTWGSKRQLTDTRMILFCNNSAVVEMINSQVSKCKNCMYLIRLLTLNNLVYNRRVFARHVSSKDSFLSDALSRLQFKRFWKLAPKDMNTSPSQVSTTSGQPQRFGNHSNNIINFNCRQS